MAKIRTSVRPFVGLAAAVSLLVLGVLPARAAPAASGVDWTTYGFDAARTGYNPSETVLGRGNAAGLHVAWSRDLGDVMIAQPVEAAGVNISGTPTNVLYEGTEHGDLYALNAGTGDIVWQVNLGSVSTNCFDMPDGVFGIGGAGAIDRSAGVIYVAGGDGAVHALDLATGGEASGWPVTGVFDARVEHVYGGINEDPATGQLYVTVASHCDFGRYYGTTDQIDTATGAIVHRFYPATRNVVGGGIWGPGGAAIDLATHHVFVATGNALTNPESFHYSEDVVELGGSLKVLGANYPGLIGGDVDFGATPILYQAPGCAPQVAAKNKSGVFVVYTRGDVSSGPTQRLQVASVNDYQFNGIPAYSPRDRTIYIGNSSDTSDPQAPYRHGMVALKVQPDCSLALAWQKMVGPNFSSVSPPTVANGVVYYGDGYGNTEYAFDSTTGRMLWNSGASIGGGLYAAPTVVNGTLYVPSWDHALYAFTP